MAVLRLTLLLLLSVWAVQAEELETHWRKAKLPDGLENEMVKELLPDLLEPPAAA